MYWKISAYIKSEINTYCKPIILTNNWFTVAMLGCSPIPSKAHPNAQKPATNSGKSTPPWGPNKTNPQSLNLKTHSYLNQIGITSVCAKFQLSSWSRSGLKVCGGGGVVEHVTTVSNSNASCFRVVLSWVELHWVLTIVGGTSLVMAGGKALMTLQG